MSSTYVITAENNQQRFKDVVYKGGVKNYVFDFSPWSDKNRYVTSVDWEVINGQAAISNNTLTSKVTTTFNEDFNDANGLTFDSNEISLTVINGEATAALNPNPLETFNQPYTSDTGFTYDSAKTEFSGGQVQQLDTTPTDSVIAATYTTVTDASWNKVGSTTGTLNGSPIITASKLVCTGAQGVYYGVNSDGAAAVKFKYTPNYTGSPPANINVITLQEASGNSNRIVLTHSPSGNTLRMTLNDNTGSSVIAIATTIGGSPSFNASVEYEIELNWDNVAGNVRVFIDGALHGTLSPGAWTHGTGVVRLYAGAAPNVYDRSEASYADVVLFDTVQHTTAYTAGYTLNETIYLADTITNPTFNYTAPGNLQGFVSFTTTEANSPRYILNGEYWNGAAWVASSDTYATASSVADINTNIAALTANDSLVIKTVFDAGNAIVMSVSDLTVGYTGQEYLQTDPTLTINETIVSDVVHWDSFVPTETVTGNDSITYSLSYDNGALYNYWNGSSWVASDGTVAQSNSSADINSNVGTFPITEFGMKIKIHFHSDDGTTTPSIGNLDVKYIKGGHPAIASGLITFSESGGNFIKVTANTALDKYVVWLDVLCKDGTYPIDGYDYWNIYESY